MNFCTQFLLLLCAFRTFKNKNKNAILHALNYDDFVDAFKQSRPRSNIRQSLELILIVEYIILEAPQLPQFLYTRDEAGSTISPSAAKKPTRLLNIMSLLYSDYMMKCNISRKIMWVARLTFRSFFFKKPAYKYSSVWVYLFRLESFAYTFSTHTHTFAKITSNKHHYF